MIQIDNTETLGNVLRIARKSLGLTQSQLALAAGVGLRFIVELEAGKPSLRIAQALRVINTLGGQIAITGLPTKPDKQDA